MSQTKGTQIITKHTYLAVLKISHTIVNWWNSQGQISNVLKLLNVIFQTRWNQG